MAALTSATSPIRVDFIPKVELGRTGQLGMTLAPGKKGAGIDGVWDRDLVADLGCLRSEYATDVLVSLVEEHELRTLQIESLKAAAKDAGIAIERFPIPDGGIPARAAAFVDSSGEPLRISGGAGPWSSTVAAVSAAPASWQRHACARSAWTRTSRLRSFAPRDPEPSKLPLKQTSFDTSTSRRVKSRSEPHWNGWGGLDRQLYNDGSLETRDAVANAAKQCDWSAVLDLLQRHPDLVNSWRPGGTSWFAPLHQAAYGGAPVSVVKRLLALGAWRTLPTAKGARPVDIARERGHGHLVGALEPHPVRDVDATELTALQKNFHDVIRRRIPNHDGLLEKLRLPELAPLTEYASPRFCFRVPRMVGGFVFWLGDKLGVPTLTTESWSRVADGSGQRHEITPGGAVLVDKGFV